MSVRALVVDDEPLARRAIRRFLGKQDGVDVIGECGDGESAVRAIRERKPDLVFLDIQMPEMDGFQVLSEIGADKMPVTIFVTAYDRYALRAFDANAIDYLLKPVGKARFERALTRAQRRIAGELKHDEMHRIISSLERLAAVQTYSDRLAISTNGRVQFVATKDIDWIEAEGNYVRLHVGKCEHEFRETLAGLAAATGRTMWLLAVSTQPGTRTIPVSPAWPCSETTVPASRHREVNCRKHSMWHMSPGICSPHSE